MNEHADFTVREQFKRYVLDCSAAGEELEVARGLGLDEEPPDFREPVANLLERLESCSDFLPKEFRELLGLTDRNATYADAVGIVRSKLADRRAKRAGLSLLQGGVSVQTPTA